MTELYVGTEICRGPAADLEHPICDKSQEAEFLCLSEGCVDMLVVCKSSGTPPPHEKIMPHGDEIKYLVGSAAQDG